MTINCLKGRIMNTYLKLKNRHEKEFNNFPMFFAFNKKQFEIGCDFDLPDKAKESERGEALWSAQISIEEAVNTLNEVLE